MKIQEKQLLKEDIKMKQLQKLSSQLCQTTKNTQREWVYLPQLKDVQDQVKIRFMSYNILAPCYVFLERYQNCDPQDLDWLKREKLIKNEINIHMPDIISLQELQQDISKDLLDFMIETGFHYKFDQKNSKLDGCATFWKDQRFDLIWSDSINMNLSEQFSNLSFLNSENLVQFIVLYDKNLQIHILNVNTHLAYSMSQGKRKLAQICIILQAIHKISKHFENKNLNVVLNGDFNLIPNSLLYRFITTGKFNINQSYDQKQFSNQVKAIQLQRYNVDANYHFNQITQFYKPKSLMLDYEQFIQQIQTILNIDIQLVDNKLQILCRQNENNGLNFDKQVLSSQIPLISSYSYINRCKLNQKDDQQVSTFERSISHVTNEFKATVDYIFYKSNQIKPLSVLDTISYDHCKSLSAFPNNQFPSDHCSLIVDFFKI